MFFGEGFALGAAHGGVVEVAVGEVGADGSLLGYVSLGVWKGGWGEEALEFLRVAGGVAEAGDEFEVVGVVVCGAFERDAVCGVTGEGGSEAGGLEVGVFGAFSVTGWEDAWEEGAGGVGWVQKAVDAWVYGEL